MSGIEIPVSKEILDLFLRSWAQRGLSYNVRKAACNDDTAIYESTDLPWYHGSPIAQSVKKQDGSFEHTIFVCLPYKFSNKKIKLVAGKRPVPFMTETEKREWADEFSERIKPPLDSNRPPKL